MNGSRRSGELRSLEPRELGRWSLLDGVVRQYRGTEYSVCMLQVARGMGSHPDVGRTILVERYVLYFIYCTAVRATLACTTPLGGRGLTGHRLSQGDPTSHYITSYTMNYNRYTTRSTQDALPVPL